MSTPRNAWEQEQRQKEREMWRDEATPRPKPERPKEEAVPCSDWVGAPTMTPERRAALWTRLLQLCREHNVTPRDVQMVLEAERRTQSDGAPTDQDQRQRRGEA